MRAAREPDHDGDLDRGRRRCLDPDRTRGGAQPRAAAGLPVLPRHHRGQRTFQEIIIAIVFVAMFGFGPLAGF
jgi:hypothetical protein